MEKQIKHTLGKNERLKSRKLIEQLFKDGKSFSVFPLRVYYLKSENLQAGFSVSTKHFKNAVDRNRIKRLMREAYRLQKHSLDNVSLAIFFIYVGNELPDYDLIFDKVKSSIKRLQKILNEDSTANT